MSFKWMKSEIITEGRVTHRPDAVGISHGVRSAAWRDMAKRNFILQQGFGEPAPAVRPRQYSALVFQPKVVFVTTAAGILIQSAGIFAALGAVLCMSALFPQLNPITAVYNLTIGRRTGAFRLGPAPAPRRAAETEAGTFALIIALLIHAGFGIAAFVFEAIFVAASLAVLIVSFCTGTFVYHLVRGRWEFVRQTLPWANHVRYLTKASKFQG